MIPKNWFRIRKTRLGYSRESYQRWADFIHQHFLSHDDQNTLYSMRWNPKNPGEHQYATDIKWAESNAQIIADFYKEMKTEGKYFKLYVYKDDNKHQK